MPNGWRRGVCGPQGRPAEVSERVGGCAADLSCSGRTLIWTADCHGHATNKLEVDHRGGLPEPELETPSCARATLSLDRSFLGRGSESLGVGRCSMKRPPTSNAPTRPKESAWRRAGHLTTPPVSRKAPCAGACEVAAIANIVRKLAERLDRVERAGAAADRGSGRQRSCWRISVEIIQCSTQGLHHTRTHASMRAQRAASTHFTLRPPLNRPPSVRTPRPRSNGVS